MLWAACCLGFFGFLRAGEFTTTPSRMESDAALSVGDIGVESRADPKILVVHLRHSKTVLVCVFSWGELVIFSAQSQQFCNTWIYVPWARAHCSSSMITAHCHALGWFYICERPSQAGVDTSLFSGHSFRIGAASTAAQAGLNDSLIQTLGRCKSSAFLAYIRTPVDDLISVAEKLAR